jgi:nucleotide-binding universal stress UspA family protein
MLRRILVPLDGSPFAEEALPAALRLSQRDAAQLDLVMVQEPPLRDPKFDHDLHRQRGAYLDLLFDRLGERDWARGTSALLTGRPVETLVERIQSHGADLVVMTTHARGAARRAWLGSVADGLVRRSPVPVLLLRPTEEEGRAPNHGPYNRVLVPLDGSPGGEEIFDRAIEVTGTQGVHYTLLRVLTRQESPVAEVLPRRGEVPTTRAQRATVESLLESTAHALRSRGLEVEAETVINDSPARGIARYAEAHGIDLIAMTTRSKGGLERWILGSVADEVLRGSTCPLLVVNPGANDATA